MTVTIKFDLVMDQVDLHVKFFAHTSKARLTISYGAPSQSDLIMNMQNCLVHHLINTKLCCALHCVQWYRNILKMSGATPTSHRHRSPLCTMVHNAGQWCTMHVGGAHCSSNKSTYRGIDSITSTADVGGNQVMGPQFCKHWAQEYTLNKLRMYS